MGSSLLALHFILAGLVKIRNPAPFVDHMIEYKVPKEWLPI